MVYMAGQTFDTYGEKHATKHTFVKVNIKLYAWQLKYTARYLFDIQHTKHHFFCQALAGHFLRVGKTTNRHGKMKRYNVIVKLRTQQFLKHQVNDLLQLTTYLDKKYAGQWTWFNVFDSRTRQQVANFTNKRRPVSATV